MQTRERGRPGGRSANTRKGSPRRAECRKEGRSRELRPFSICGIVPGGFRKGNSAPAGAYRLPDGERRSKSGGRKRKAPVEKREAGDGRKAQGARKEARLKTGQQTERRADRGQATGYCSAADLSPASHTTRPVGATPRSNSTTSAVSGATRLRSESVTRSPVTTLRPSRSGAAISA